MKSFASFMFVCTFALCAMLSVLMCFGDNGITVGCDDRITKQIGQVALYDLPQTNTKWRTSCNFRTGEVWSTPITNNGVVWSYKISDDPRSYAIGVMTNEPSEYIVQCRYGGAYQGLGSNIFGTPKFYNDPLKHYTLHTAPRFRAKQIKDLIAPKDYRLYNDMIFFRIRKVGDEYRLKEVTLEEMN